ncbi:MAG: GntR family transcriptional regulator [Anaerolineae bacterium]
MAILAPQAQYRTKQAMVYDRLREAILKGELGAGTRLIINDLAEQLNVSPSPVREAIQQLHAEGLVSLIPHVGAVVTSVSPDEVREIFALLESLEVIGSRVAAERLTPDDLQRLRAILAEMNTALSDGDSSLWTDLNREFHLEVCRIADMALLTEFTAKVLDRWQRVRHAFIPNAPLGYIRETQAEHEAIVDAMAARDFDCLESLTREHNRKAMARYGSALQPNRSLRLPEHAPR